LDNRQDIAQLRERKSLQSRASVVSAESSKNRAAEGGHLAAADAMKAGIRRQSHSRLSAYEVQFQ
jgi:hypothetical protein